LNSTPENRRQHLRGEVLGVVAGGLLGLAEGMVLAQVAVPDRLLGMAMPIEAAHRRWGSLVLRLAHDAEDDFA